MRFAVLGLVATVLALAGCRGEVRTDLNLSTLAAVETHEFKRVPRTFRGQRILLVRNSFTSAAFLGGNRQATDKQGKNGENELFHGKKLSVISFGYKLQTITHLQII